MRGSGRPTSALPLCVNSGIRDNHTRCAVAGYPSVAGNAVITAYDLYPKPSPFSVKDQLKAHQVMMTALDDTPGQFRRSGVGVTDGKRVIHMAPPAANVPPLINNLFGWLKKAPDHLLFKSCVFQFLPVENRVHASQQAYYDAINASSAQADCAPFIDFMLGEIHRTLDSRKGEPKDAGIGINDTQKQILLLVNENRAITATQLAGKIGIARRNIETNLAQLKKTGLLRRVGAKRNGHWELISPTAKTGGAG